MAQTLENELCGDMNCSPGQTIKKCFIKWSLRNHPDKGGDNKTYAEINGKINENIKKYKCQETTSSKKNGARQAVQRSRQAEQARKAEERLRREAVQRSRREATAAREAKSRARQADKEMEEQLRKAAEAQTDKQRQEAVQRSRRQAREERYEIKKKQLLKGFKKTILDLKNDMLDELYEANPKIIRSQYTLFILQQGSDSYLMIAELIQNLNPNIVSIKNSSLSEPRIGIAKQITPGGFQIGENKSSLFSAIGSSLDGSTIYVLNDEALELHIERHNTGALWMKLNNEEITDVNLQKFTNEYLNGITLFGLSNHLIKLPNTKKLNIIQLDDVPEETMEGGYKRNRKQRTKKKYNKTNVRKRRNKKKTTRSSSRRRKQLGRKTQKRKGVKHTRNKKRKSRK